MKKIKEGNKVKVFTKNGIKTGKVVKVFREVGGESHGQEFVTIVLDDPSLSMWENEVVYHISEVQFIA
jgi:hypothetical protein